WQRQASGATLSIAFNVDWPQNGGWPVGRDSREDLEDRAAMRTTAHRDDGLALFGGGLLVENQLKGSVAFVNRTGKRENRYKPDAVETNRPEISLGDTNR